MPERRMLIDGLVGEPLFKTREQYEEFRQSYISVMGPILRKQAIARAKSEEEARHHWVD